MKGYKLVKVIIQGLKTTEEEVRHFFLTVSSKNRSYTVQREIPVRKEGLAYVQDSKVTLELIYGDTFIFEVQTVTQRGQKSPFSSFEKKIDYSVPAPQNLQFSGVNNKVRAIVNEDSSDTVFYEWIVKPRDYPGVIKVVSSTNNTVTVTGLAISLNVLAGRKIYIKGSSTYYTIVSNTATSGANTSITISSNWSVNPMTSQTMVIATEVDFSKDVPTHRTSNSDPLLVTSSSDESIYYWVRRVSSYGGVSPWYPSSHIGSDTVNNSQGWVKPTAADLINPMGNYSASATYKYETGIQRDVVKYNGLYYYVLNPGSVTGQAPSGTKSDNAYWGYFESFRAIATQLLLVEDGSIISSLTMGDASHDGIIQSYGWDGSKKGYKLKGGANPEFSSIGAIITGGRVQTHFSTEIPYFGATIYTTPTSIQVNSNSGFSATGGRGLAETDTGFRTFYYTGISSTNVITGVSTTGSNIVMKMGDLIMPVPVYATVKTADTLPAYNEQAPFVIYVNEDLTGANFASWFNNSGGVAYLLLNNKFIPFRYTAFIKSGSDFYFSDVTSLENTVYSFGVGALVFPFASVSVLTNQGVKNLGGIIKGADIIGPTIRTAESGKRIEISSFDQTINFYHSDDRYSIALDADFTNVIDPAIFTMGRLHANNGLSTAYDVDANSVIILRGGSIGFDCKKAIDIDSGLDFANQTVGITICGDTNIYRSAANTLKTDDNVIIVGTLTVGGKSVLVANAVNSSVQFRDITDTVFEMSVTDGQITALGAM
ncbi:MAG TPA: hypothetical protein VHO03_17055 [Ignavibacteriales bacterium]|nr:hypothetical protein [Ignavibacteriales bacterium]